MIAYKDGVNVLEMLSDCGFTTYVLRKRQLLGQGSIHKLRKGGLPSWQELDIICSITNLNVGDILEFRRDENLPL